MVDQKEYWDSNLDPQNLEGQVDFDLETELAFLKSPEQLYAWQQLEPVENKSILEIGPGLGVNAVHLARQGAIIIAMDLSGERLVSLKKLIQQQQLENKILLIQASVEALPFVSDSIDRAFTKSVLLHTDLEKSLPQVNRTLKQDGKAIFIEPLTGNPFVNLYRALFAPKIWKEIAIYFGREQTAQVKKSFKDLQYHDFFCISFFAFLFQYGFRNLFFYKLLMPPFQAIDKFMFTILPFTKRMAWMRVFTGHKLSEEKEIVK